MRSNQNNNSNSVRSCASQKMKVPLPSFSWANGAEVWNCMLEKDTQYAKMRSPRLLERHPSLKDSYRAILFDWLSEVSHECKFHRETYHLALDFIDRYLSAQSNVGKLQLQLIGTTCLFLAAKFEEIQPPTVSEFADLTDGACQPEDIIDNEVVILEALNWEITPMTPNNWLNTYMQILLNLDDTSNNDSFILPATNGIFRSNHKRIASVIDLALLHTESLKFSSSILAASAIFHFTDEITVHQCTGYRVRELADCIRWLRPFVETIKLIRETVFIASCKGETHSTQMHTHIATAKLLDKVLVRIADEEAAANVNDENQQVGGLKRKSCCIIEHEVMTDSENSDCPSMLSPNKPTTLLTPPRSARKTRRVH